MRCANCGHENANQAKHCTSCGQRLNAGPNPEYLRLQALLDAGQFATLIKAVPAHASADLLQLRVEAQSRFDATVKQMVVLAEQRFAQNEWSTRRALTALGDLRKQTPARNALDLPEEAAAYAEVLLAEARALKAQGEFAQARARLNALQVLPQQREAHQQTIEALLKGMPPVESSTRTRRLSDSGSEPTAPPPTGLPRFTLPSEPEAKADSVSLPPPRLPSFTLRLPSLPDESTAPPPADAGQRVAATPPPPLPPATAEEAATTRALEALEALEVHLKQQAELPHKELARSATERPGWREFVAAQVQAQNLVAAAPSLAPNLEGASNRLALLRDDTQALLTALSRPDVDWFSTQKGALEQTIKDHFTKLERGFGPDVAPVPALRAYRDQRLGKVRVLEAQLASLVTLEGAALATQLDELTRLQIPVPLAAQQRLAAYKETLKADQEVDAARRDRATRIETHREKRRELDNLHEDAAPALERFLTLRNEARDLAASTLLTPTDNPLDPATFAYYDLLFANRYRTLTAPTAEAQLAQTLLGKGDYLNAYQTLLREATRLEKSDDTSAFQTTVKLRDNALVALRQNLEETTREALTLAQKSLERFDFQAADQTLVAQHKYIDDASITIDKQLLTELTQAEQATRKLADRDRVARALIERADQLTLPGSASPDYRTALEALDNAGSTAEWLKASIERQAEQVRQRRSTFVAGQLQLAEGRIKGGTTTAFAEAENFLASAELNADADSQRLQISTLRAKIGERQQALNQLEELRATALSFAEAARNGTNLDVLPGRILLTRDRIGPANDPKFEAGTWAELDRYLTTAETLLAAREQFNGLVAKAEQAALLGQEEAFQQLLAEINTLTGKHPFLKLGTAEALARQARQGSQIDRVRQHLNKIRRRIEVSDQNLTAEEINTGVLISKDAESDEEVKRDRAFLTDMLPIYQGRDLLKNALRVTNFAEFDRVYNGLTPELQGDPRISRLKQEAEIEQAQARFQDGYNTLQGKANEAFSDGWIKPASLKAFVSQLRAFADQLPKEQRQAEPALAPDVIRRLDSLAEALSEARASYEAKDYPEALSWVESATTAIDDGKLQDTYAANLTTLKTRLGKVYQQINSYITGGDTDKVKLENAVRGYSDTVSNPLEAFVKAKLVAVRNPFALPGAAESEAVREGYATILKRITDLIDATDALEDLIISGHAHGEQTPARQSGDARLALVEKAINLILAESKEIRKTKEGGAWLGINEYECFKVLNEHRQLAHILAEAKLWLERARNLQHSVAELRRLRSEVEPFKKLNLTGSKIAGDLERAKCTTLLAQSQTLYNEIAQRVPRIETELEQRRRQRQRTVGASLLLITLLALGLGGWYVPNIRNQVTERIFGTPTPTLTPTLGGTAIAVGPTILIVTVTPSPTLTPIPPQAGVVTVPGIANVRERPNLDLAPFTTKVELGDAVLVTGYTTASDGALWYRLDVPSRALQNVWLLAEVSDRGRLWPSLRIDGGAALNPALQLAYQP